MQASIPVKSVEKRLVLIFILFLLVTLVLDGKLIFIQAVQGQKFGSYAVQQRLRKLEIPAFRGKITDRNGEVLANSVLVKSIYATPYLIRKPKIVAERISSILKIDRLEVEKKLFKKSGFVYLARKVPVNTADLIKDLKYDGIGFLDEIKRVYPAGYIGAQLIGFTNTDNKGLGGIELRANKVISGRAGELIAERDPYGRIIPGGVSKTKIGQKGGNVALTIDEPIQYVAQTKLDETIKKFKADAGTLIAMDVQNGEILAMVNSPSFNPNKPRNDIARLRNRAVSDVYEPGSTMKTVIVSGALEDGIVTPEQKFLLRPNIRIGNKVVKESHRSITRTFTVSEIIEQSSNIGAITIGLMMGKNSIHSWIDKFGLTEPTGIELPAESSGFLPAVKKWSRTTIGNVPIGQGVTVTPIQMLRAVAAMANGGYLVKPKILLDSKKIKGSEPKRVISAETSEKMRNILKLVVEKGTGDLAKIPGYTAAGKTGTAQKPKVGARGYDSGKYIASFVGFYPAEKPKVAMVVILDNPKPIWGGVVAAPLFGDVGKFVVSRLRIMPD